jgi:hypothetical protein
LCVPTVPGDWGALADSSAGSVILEYAPGGNAPIRSISTPPNTRAITAGSLAIDSSNVLFALGSFQADQLGPYPLPTGYSAVEVIAPGSSRPKLTIQAAPSADYLAVDRTGNVFV